MVNARVSHVADVVFCVFGTLSGLSGGVSFGVIFINDAAALWASVSGGLALCCLLVELLRYNRLLHTCFTPATLLVMMLLALAIVALSSLLFAFHLSLGIKNGEPYPSKNSILHSDYIIAVWTFMTLKYSLKLVMASSNCHKLLREQLEQEQMRRRCDSPDLLQEDAERRSRLSRSSSSHDTMVRSVDSLRSSRGGGEGTLHGSGYSRRSIGTPSGSIQQSSDRQALLSSDGNNRLASEDDHQGWLADDVPLLVCDRGSLLLHRDSADDPALDDMSVGDMDEVASMMKIESLVTIDNGQTAAGNGHNQLAGRMPPVVDSDNSMAELSKSSCSPRNEAPSDGNSSSNQFRHSASRQQDCRVNLSGDHSQFSDPLALAPLVS